MDPLYRPGASRNPDTVFLFALCIFAGLSQLAAGQPPGSVEDLLPAWASVLWGVLLVFSGSLVMLGSLWRNLEKGERIELVGRCMFGPFALSYAVALASAQPTGDALVAALAAAPFVGFAIACMWRAWQIIRRINNALKTRGMP